VKKFGNWSIFDEVTRRTYMWQFFLSHPTVYDFTFYFSTRTALKFE